MLEMTVQELADRVKLEKQIVYGLLKYLEAIGKAKIIKTVPPASGKGKPSNVYQFPETVIVTFIV